MMKRILPLVIISLVMLVFLPLLRANSVIVVVSRSQSSASPTSSGSASPTPTPSPFATPVALASPVVVIAAGQHVRTLANTSIGTGSMVGDGVTDDTAAFVDAVTRGKLLILGNNECTGTPNSTSFVSGSVSGDNPCCTGLHTGTCNPSGGYFINTSTTAIAAIELSSAEDIRCGDGTGSENQTVYFKMPGTPSGTAPGNWRAISFDSTGTIFGCGFRGPQYNTTAPATPGIANQMFVYFRNNGNQASNNDFNGVGGNNGAINIQSTSTTGSQVVSYNTFENCGHYAIQAGGDGGVSVTGEVITLDHNTLTDCNCCVEGQFTGAPVITMSNGHSTYINGSGWSNTGGGVATKNYVYMIGEGGATTLSNYSSSAITNWVCDGTKGANSYRSCLTPAAHCQATYTSTNQTVGAGSACTLN